MAASSSSDQGQVYTDFVAAELHEERGRSERLIGRAGRLQRSGGTVIALLAATVGLSGRSAADSQVAVICFGLASLALICAMVFGVLGERLMPYEVADRPTLEAMLGNDRWGDDSVDSRFSVARVRLKTIFSLRSASQRRVQLIERGVGVHLVGVGLAGIGVVLLVLRI